MSSRLVTILAVLAGFFLAIAGMTFLIWQPPSDAASSIVAIATYLSTHQMANFLYVISVLLSGVLFLPVILILTIRMYREHPNASIVASSLFGLGSILEITATMASLSQWAFAVPEAAQGDPLAIKLYQTLNVQYLAVDFTGVGLVYVAAVIYAAALWNIHRTSSMLLLVSIGLLLVGFAAMPLVPSIGPAITAGSIVVYGAAYIALGRAAVILGK